MQASTLYDQVIMDSKKIPAFINARSQEHHLAYITMSNMLVILGTLIQRRIWTDIEIWTLLVEFEERASDFVLIESLPLFMNMTTYINSRINSYLELALEDEEYEIATNLRKFRDERRKYTVFPDEEKNS